MLTIRDSDAQSISDFITSLWQVIDLQSEILASVKAGKPKASRAVLENGESLLADERRKLSVMQEQHQSPKEIEGHRLLRALMDPATKMGSWVKSLKDFPKLPAELAEKIDQHNEAYDSLLWPGEVVSRKEMDQSWQAFQKRLRAEGMLKPSAGHEEPQASEEGAPETAPSPFASKAPRPRKPTDTGDDNDKGGKVVRFDPSRFGRG